jgi:hypothetical protein
MLKHSTQVTKTYLGNIYNFRGISHYKMKAINIIVIKGARVSEVLRWSYLP